MSHKPKATVSANISALMGYKPKKQAVRPKPTSKPSPSPKPKARSKK